MSEKFYLKWSDFQANLLSTFGSLIEDFDFVDVTLACEDNYQIEAHKVVLSASSPFFRNILKKNKHPHPLVYLRGVQPKCLDSVMSFIYFGEVSIDPKYLEGFITLARELKLKGLEYTEENKVDTQHSLNLHENKQESHTNSIEGHVKDEELIDAMAPTKTVFNGDMEELNAKITSMMIKTDGSWECILCGKTSDRIVVLKRHIEAIHIEGVAYPCKFCDKTFKIQNYLRKHVTAIHSSKVKHAKVINQAS